MAGCGLRNEGRAWVPYGSEARWLLLGFAEGVYASGVAVYESGGYGGVRQLVLIDDAGGYHTVHDASQGDVASVGLV